MRRFVDRGRPTEDDVAHRGTEPEVIDLDLFYAVSSHNRLSSSPIAACPEPKIQRPFHQKPRQPKSYFDLLGLPTEVRLMIFEYLLPEPVETEAYSYHQCELSDGESCELEHRWTTPRRQIRGYAALLCACKQIYTDASKVLYDYSIRRSATSIPFQLEVTEHCFAG
ncbi:hypothetical protein BKA80DRAFT_28982 [Phyllosticta citrichinensis]